MTTNFTYNPVTSKLPPLPKITMGSSLPQAPTINNNYAKDIVDAYANKIKTPQSFTSQNDINNILYPTQELGNQFIQQNLLPEFMQNQYNPFQRSLANSLAGSNASLLGGASEANQMASDRVTRPFYDQALGVQQQFADSGQNDLNRLLQSYYNSQNNN